MVVYSGVNIYYVTINLETMPLLLVQMALIRSLPNNLNNMIHHLLDLVTASDDKKKQESANGEDVEDVASNEYQSTAVD